MCSLHAGTGTATALPLTASPQVAFLQNLPCPHLQGTETLVHSSFDANKLLGSELSQEQCISSLPKGQCTLLPRAEMLLKTESFYNPCAHLMPGKGFLLMSSVFPSGACLRIWAETPGSPHVSSE